MVRIRKQLVKVSSKVGYLGTNSRKYITIHETDNFSRGANAAMHAKLQSNGNSRKAGWHYQVDDYEAVQSFVHTAQPWHAGSGTGNRQSIGIEICVNSDGDYKKAVQNAAELVKKIMKEENIPLSNVVQHNHWSGKNCPRYLRSGSKGVNWNGFKNMIQRTPGKVDNSNTSAGKPAGANVGGSIVDYLNSKGIDSSFGNRKKLAEEYGIGNYSGTAAQNTQLLEKMKAGKKPESNPTQSSSYKGNSIVDYLNSIKVDASYGNRKKLASQYGVKNYNGTASQNKELLEKMRSGKKTSTYKGSSLVDYLNSIGENTSFSNRKKLAAKYGIKNYKGTAAQNTQLLNKMR